MLEDESGRRKSGLTNYANGFLSGVLTVMLMAVALGLAIGMGRLIVFGTCAGTISAALLLGDFLSRRFGQRWDSSG